ncbi:dimethylaniline monooxygenase [N-oxide-forming] 4-like [Trichechus inunguis]
MAKRVAIVGAGVSGLASIKCCLEEGLEPTCFERSDNLGGLWRFTEHVEEGRASLYKSVISNTCKELSCYSDFPFPEDYPNFLRHSLFLEYLQMYADRFNLRNRIQFKTKVCSVAKRPDFTVSGQWDVVTLHEGKQESAVFDAVMICTGFLTTPNLPLGSFPGINDFKGQYFHSREYKHPDIFKDKRVLVIGMGNSGTDIAVEASHLAKKVFLSTTGGAWAISRVYDSGYPWDMVFITRFQNMFRNYLPTPILFWLLARKMNSWFNHENYGLAPEDRIQLRQPVLNDELPGCIITGKVLIKPSVKEVKENLVIFNNTPKEEPIDIIVFATGYTFAFPFLDESVVKVEDGQASLYKYIFPTHLQKSTLAVIGLIKTFGPVIPTGELQARWAVRVLKGVNTLPPPSVMIKEVDARKQKKPSGFGLCYCKPLESDYITYMDELLTLINAKPNLFSMLLTDPRLALTVFFGPCSPYQFRLTGPGKWKGARNAIMTQWDRTFKVTKTRIVQKSPSVFEKLLKLLSFLALLIAIFLKALLDFPLTKHIMAKRVAVIGAGVSGLSSIKCCLDEDLEPICFERSNDIGGLWKFTETSKDGMTRVYKSLVTNVCKEMSCYSDFPFQEDYPNFMKQEKFWHYLQEFAEHFDLLKYIQFKTTVCSVTKCPDFSVSGQWDVITETEDKKDRAVFDAVMVCTGHFLNPRLPLESFPGIHNFKGHILHSQEYKIPVGFQDKRVLVIGLGNTGGDIAVELSRTAAQVLLSTRTGAWVVGRSSHGGYPFNMMITRRCYNFIEQILPSCVLKWIQERQMNKIFNHENYGLSITKGKKSKIIVNDELPTCILCGSVTMKTSVKEFTETSALFEDGTVEENIDVVIFTTGYTFSFPFLEEPLKSLCSKKLFLYKKVFPSNLEKATLAIIGLISLKGSILSGTELQARWATRVFKGLCKLPPSQKLMADATKKEQLIKRNVIKDNSEDKLDYIPYLDDLAACIGTKPNVPLLFLKDPRLAWEVFFGPCTPYQYRLMGPGKWNGARNAILTQWDRTLKPLKTRVVHDSSKPASMSHYLKVWGTLVLLASLLLLCKSSLCFKLLWDKLQDRISPYQISIW